MNKIAKDGKLEIKKSLLLIQDALTDTKDFVRVFLQNIYLDSNKVQINYDERLNAVLENVNNANNELLLSMEHHVNK